MNRPLPRGKNKKVIGIMKHELGGKILKEFVRLRTKTYSYLIDDSIENKEEDYKNRLEAAQPENKIYQLEENKVNVDSFNESHRELIKNNKLILKTQ